MHWLMPFAAAALLAASGDPQTGPLGESAARASGVATSGADQAITSPAYMKSRRFQEFCQASDLERDRAVCLGYLEGVWDSLSVLNPILTTSDAYEFNICLPQDVKVQAVAELTLEWMQQNPERDQETAASLIILALLERYPCAQNAPT